MNQTEEITEAKIFQGCKHPQLVDQYIEGITSGTKERVLTSLLTRIEELEEFEVNIGMYGEDEIAQTVVKSAVKALIEEALNP